MALSPELQRELQILQNRIAVIEADIAGGATGEELVALQLALEEAQTHESRLQNEAQESDEQAFQSPAEAYDAFWLQYRQENPPAGGTITPEYAAAARPWIRDQIIDTTSGMPDKGKAAFNDLIESLADNPEFHVESKEEILNDSLLDVDEAYNDSLGEIPEPSPVSMFATVSIESQAASITFAGDALTEDKVVKVTAKGLVWSTFVAAGMDAVIVTERVFLEGDIPEFEGSGMGTNYENGTIVLTHADGWTVPPVVEILDTLSVGVVETLPSQVVTLIYAGEFVPPITYQHEYILSDGATAVEYEPIANDALTIEEWIAIWAQVMTDSGHWDSVVHDGGRRLTLDAGAGKTCSLFAASISNQYFPIPLSVDPSSPATPPNQFVITVQGDEASDGQAMWMDFEPYGYLTYEIPAGQSRDDTTAAIISLIDNSGSLDAESSGSSILITAPGNFSGIAPDAGILTGYDQFAMLADIGTHATLGAGVGKVAITGSNPLGNEVFVIGASDTQLNNEGIFTVRLGRNETGQVANPKTPEEAAVSLAASINSEGEFSAAIGDGVEDPITTVLIEAVGATNYMKELYAQTLHGAGPVSILAAGGAADAKLVTVTLSGGPATGDEYLDVRVTYDISGERIFYIQSSFGQTVSELATQLALEMDSDPVVVANSINDLVEIRGSDPNENITAITAVLSDTPPPTALGVFVTGSGPVSTEVLMSITGGPATGGEQLSWSVIPDGGAPIVGTIPPAAGGDTNLDVATALAAQITAEANLTAVAVGAQVDVSPSGTSIYLTDASASMVGAAPAITAVHGGDGPTSISVTVTIGGGPAIGNESIDVGFTADAGADQPFSTAANAADTASEIATALAAVIDLDANFSASAVAEVITVIPAGTTTYITAANATVVTS